MIRKSLKNLAPDIEYLQEDRKDLICRKETVLLNEYSKYLKYKGYTDKEQEFFEELQTLQNDCFLNTEQSSKLGQLFMQFKINMINAFANCKKVYVAIGYKVKQLDKK